jgi:hypothetical protein
MKQVASRAGCLLSFLDYCPAVKKEATYSLETSVYFQRATLPCIQEYRTFRLSSNSLPLRSESSAFSPANCKALYFKDEYALGVSEKRALGKIFERNRGE